MTRWAWKVRSVGVARQAAYDTENTTASDFEWFHPEMALPEMARSVQSIDAPSGQVGAFEPPVVGNKHGGKCAIKFALRGPKTTFDWTAEGLGEDVPLSPGLRLFLAALGGAGTTGVTSNADFQHGKAASSTWAGFGNAARLAAQITGGTPLVDATVTVAAGTKFVVGQFFVSSTNNDGVPTMGWIKSIAGNTLTLFAITAATCANLDDAHGTYTGYLSRATQVPVSMRVVGDDAAFGVVLIGLVANKWTLRLHPGMQPEVEIEYTYTSRKFDSSIGGIKVPTYAYLQSRQLQGGNGARTVLDGAAVCGVADLEITCEYDIAYVPCAGSLEGVSEAVTTDHRLTVSAWMPYDSTDTIADGEHEFETDFVNGTARSLQVEWGKTAGQMGSILLPALHHAEQPKLEEREGMIGWRCSFRPSRYVGDGTTTSAGTAPADTLFRIGGA